MLDPEPGDAPMPHSQRDSLGRSRSRGDAAGAPAPPRRRTLRERREATRDALKDAAVEVFARLGFFEATVDEIARGAKTSSASFYKHFESKEHVFAEIEKDTNAELERRVFDAALATQGAGALATIEAIAATVIESFESDLARFKMLVTGPRPLLELTPEGEAMMPRLRAELAARIATMGADRSVDIDDIHLTVAGLFQLWNRAGVYYLSRAGGGDAAAMRAKTIAFLVRMTAAMLSELLGRPVARRARPRESRRSPHA